MNESMLQSLMQLFAIIASINRETVLTLARNFVEAYLNQELSNKLAGKYLSVFDYYYKEIEAPEAQKKGKKTSSQSVKILTICDEINKDLHIRYKFRILLSLIQFTKYFESYSSDESEFTQTISDTVSTIAEGLMITPQEFDNCRAFITDKFYMVPDRDSILVISDDRSFRFTEIKHYQCENLKGQLLVLQIKRADTYLFHYTGSDKLELNGTYIFPRYVYFLPKGSAIRGKSISPIYYSDITSSFYQLRNADKIRFFAKDIAYYFPKSRNGIQKFSFYGESGQLVGIMGGSGTGKSTLLKVLNGILKLNSGQITINGQDLHRSRELEGLIGNIPQDDLLIEELTVFQNLYFNARLCLANRSDEEIRDEVRKMLSELGLSEIKDLKVGSPLNKFISGGQRKRLNIALELIRSPYILFVDEPTSGLSSVDSENVMCLLKEQAVKGKLIMVIIHQPSSDLFKMFDQLLVLDQGGYIVYQGNPVDALRYFKELTERVDVDENECKACGNVNPEEILQIIEARDIDMNGEYTAKRKTTPEMWYNQYLHNIQSGLKPENNEENLPAVNFKIPGIFRQFRIFSTRNFLAKAADRQFLLIALLIAPLLALILGFFTKYVSGDDTDPARYIFSRNENLPAYLFMSVIVALFLGLIISAEEIIRDRKILAREAFLNLNKSAFLLSKVLFLFALSALQMAAFVLIGNYILHIKGLNLSYWLILFSTACFANMFGLNISDGLKSVVAIYIVVPFVLVPQILLAGVIVKFDKLHYSVAAHENVPVVGDLMASRWAYEALAVNQFRNNEYQKYFFDNHQLESNISYNLQQMVPLIRERMQDIDRVAVLPDKKEETDRLIRLLKNTVFPFHREMPLKCFDRLTPDSYNDVVKSELMQYLRIVQEKLALALTRTKDQEKDIIDKLVEQYGGFEGLITLKQDHYNESLADLVLNRNELRKVYEKGDRFIRKMEPIYAMPASKTGRANFFSSYKQVGNYILGTPGFDVMAIWLMTLIMYISLQFSWLGALIRFLSRWSRDG